MKGDKVRINGDFWIVVDVAPDPALAEMVAVMLEEKGYVVMTRGVNSMGDILTHMGGHSLGTTFTLVPEADAEQAMQFISDNVSKFEGDELEDIMTSMTDEEFAKLSTEESS